MDYRITARDLITMWRVGGFGSAFTPEQADFAEYTVCPPREGRLYRLGRTTSRDWAATHYAYDEIDGRVWWWHEDCWHTITVTTPTKPDADRDARPRVAVAPAMRRYGTSYPDTADLHPTWTNVPASITSNTSVTQTNVVLGTGFSPVAVSRQVVEAGIRYDTELGYAPTGAPSRA